jgi:hypothetical protein
MASACCGPPAKASRSGQGTQSFKPLRQIIESVNDTFKASLAWNNMAGTPQQASPSGLSQRHSQGWQDHPGELSQTLVGSNPWIDGMYTALCT